MTLTEILITALILTFIVAGIFTLLNIADMGWHSDAGLLDLQQQARQAMYAMVKDLRQGRAADIVISGNNRISFYLPPEVYGDPWVGPISFYLNPTNQVIREYPQGTMRILATDIASLTFSLNANLLDIEMAAEKAVRTRQICFPAPCQTPRRVLKENVRLRN